MDNPPPFRGRTSFDTTQWSLVQAAADTSAPEARGALEALCQRYWQPLYWFLRRAGHNAEDAQDLTQGFLARLIEKHDVRQASRDRGRFRSFLLSALKHFVQNEAQRLRAQKRGGGTSLLSLDFDVEEGGYRLDAADTRTPEAVYERRWALTLIERVLQAMRRDAEEADTVREFDVLKPSLVGESAPAGYAAWAAALGSSEGAVKVAVHRLRRRFQRALRAEIAQTVLTEGDIDEELRYLAGILRR